MIGYSYKPQKITGLAGINSSDFTSIVYPANSEFRRNNSDRVIRAITPARTSGLPVSPRPFPCGAWKIIGIEAWYGDYNRAHFGEWKIRTTAEQYLDVWELDGRGCYNNPLGGKTIDTGYCLHYSDFRTSVGCLVTSDKAAWADFLAAIRAELKWGPVDFVVEE
jgi:hypothetical protein